MNGQGFLGDGSEKTSKKLILADFCCHPIWPQQILSDKTKGSEDWRHRADMEKENIAQT